MENANQSIEALISLLSKLSGDVRKLTDQVVKGFGSFAQIYRLSARNLLHYLVFR